MNANVDMREAQNRQLSEAERAYLIDASFSTMLASEAAVAAAWDRRE